MVIDNARPNAEVVTPQPDGQAYTDDFTIEARATDDNSGITKAVINLYDNNGFRGSCTNETVSPAQANYDYECAIDTGALPNGDYYVKVNAQDKAGNTSNTVIWNFTVDKNKPLANVVSPANGDVKKGSFNVSGTASDAETAVERVDYTVTEITGFGGSYVSSVDSGTASGTENWNFDVSGLSNGYYRLKVQAFDKAGNSKYDYNDVQVDVTKPATNVVSPQPDGQSYTDNFTIEAESTDNESGVVQAVINLYDASGLYRSCTNETVNPAESSYSFSCDVEAGSLANGNYYAKVNAKDAAGNVSNTVSWNFTVDNTKPSVSVVDPATGDVKTGSFMVTGTASDSETSIDRVEYTVTEVSGIGGTYVNSAVNGTANGTKDWGFNVPDLDEGYYRLKVQAFDTAGNWKYDYHDVFVDKTAPVVAAGNDQTVTGLDASLSGSSDDADASYEWQLISGPGTAVFTQAGSKDTDVTVSDYGSYVFQLSGEDAVGNTGNDTVTVVFEEPVTPSTSVPSSSSSNRSAGQSSRSTRGTNFVASSPLQSRNTRNVASSLSNVGVANNNAAASSNSSSNSNKPTELNGEVTESGNEGNGDVLSATTKNDGPLSLFGLDWYWWLPLALGAGGLGWFVFGRSRGSN